MTAPTAQRLADDSCISGSSAWGHNLVGPPSDGVSIVDELELAAVMTSDQCERPYGKVTRPVSEGRGVRCRIAGRRRLRSRFRGLVGFRAEDDVGPVVVWATHQIFEQRCIAG